MTSNSYTYSGQWNYEAFTNLDTLNLHTLLTNAYISTDINGQFISNRLHALSVMMGLRFNSDNRSGRYFTFEFNPYYNISDKSILFGSIASGFNSPPLYKLYTPESYYLSGITRGNPNLKPEKSISTELAIEVMDDAFEVGFIQDLLVFGDAQQQGIATEVVNLAGDALGVLVDGGDETVAEEGVTEANDAQMMLDVGSGLFQIKGCEVIADGDALVKGLIGGKAELVSQVRLTE